MAVLNVIMSNSTSRSDFDFCSQALIVALKVIVFASALTSAHFPKCYMPCAFSVVPFSKFLYKFYIFLIVVVPPLPERN